MTQRAAIPNRLSLQPQRERVTTLFSKVSSSRAASLFLAFGLGVVFAGYFFTRDDLTFRTFVREVYSNFGIELVSIGLTVIVIDNLNRRRADQERKIELKSQMASRSNDFALDAVRQLRQRGWLKDGSLQGTTLVRANVQGADLSETNLQGAKLIGAHLQDANLRATNLQAADLSHASLQGAHLSEANLQETMLWGVNLQGADLFVAKLYGAKYVDQAQFKQNTSLPDRTKWTLGRDLREFTHPEEWQAEQAAKDMSQEDATQGDADSAEDSSS